MKRVQHFIPKFILKKFISDKWKFKIFDKRDDRYKSPSDTMYKERFYEHDDFKPNEIEDLLATRENFYAPVIEKLINKIPLNLEEHKILLEFRHTTYYRSNEFVNFHTYKNGRGNADWEQRHDWRSIMGIFNSKDLENDIKKSRLKAIQLVINGTDPVYEISLLTPLCFVFTSRCKKFIVSDSGSLCRGNEFDGMVIIVLSPIHAVMFPRLKTALEIMTKKGVSKNESTVIYEDATEELVDLINEMAIKSSSEYYIDPSL